MSDKKYEIEYNKYSGKYEVTEVDTTPDTYEPDTNPTAREKLHENLVNMGRSGKIFLTFFFNLYGSLFRFSSNTVIGFLLGLADLLIGKILMVFWPWYVFSGEMAKDFDKPASNISYEVTTDINGAEIIDVRALESSQNFFPSDMAEAALCVFCLLPFIILIIDIISVLKKNTIVFLGDKKYLNYSDLKKRHK